MKLSHVVLAEDEMGGATVSELQMIAATWLYMETLDMTEEMAIIRVRYYKYWLYWSSKDLGGEGEGFQHVMSVEVQCFLQ